MLSTIKRRLSWGKEKKMLFDPVSEELAPPAKYPARDHRLEGKWSCSEDTVARVRERIEQDEVLESFRVLPLATSIELTSRLGIITSQCHLRSGDTWRPLDCCFYLDMVEFKSEGSGVTFSRFAMLSLFEDVVLGECAEGVFIALVSPLCAEDDLILMFPDETLSQHQHDYLYKFLKAVVVREKL